jgi:cation diffusion facilitator family transporter
MEVPSTPDPAGHSEARFAMRLSLGFGLAMLAGKAAAYWLTGSAAILSDAVESVVHVVAVGFAAFSLWLSVRPANARFTYGYERIGFFSAGFEGAMIILAAIAIIVAAIQKWRAGLPLENLGWGVALIAGAGCINAMLGWYLIRTGKKNHSIILDANGRHVLTDSWTSFGVVGGLGLVLLTGWKPFDPLFAIAVALNITWSGARLLTRAIGGLLDHSDPATGHLIREHLDVICRQAGVQYHGVRFHSLGQRLHVEVHLLFPYSIPLGVAHGVATNLETQLARELPMPAEVVTHLEALEDHANVHTQEHYMGRPE